MIIIEVIAISSRKGGTAKTTTALNLAYALQLQHRKVLLIDLDSQKNLTNTIVDFEVKNSILDVLLNDLAIEKGIVESRIKNLDIITSQLELSDFEIEIADDNKRELKLAKAINNSSLEEEYDFIVIDTAPAFDQLVINAITACNRVITTTRTSMYSFDSINELEELIELIENNFNKEIEFNILITQVDKRTNVAKEFVEDLKDIYDNQVFNTTISQNVKVIESQIEQLPVQVFDKQAKAAKQYNQLAKELIDKIT